MELWLYGKTYTFPRSSPKSIERAPPIDQREYTLCHCENKSILIWLVSHLIDSFLLEPGILVLAKSSTEFWPV